MSRGVLENKFININAADINAVTDTLNKKQLAGTSPIIQDYEESLCEYFDVKHALAVSSGTAALHLLLYLYTIKPGDEIIIPPTAPIMSALPILAVGGIPVFVDIYNDSFAFDPQDLENKITKRTKAIISVPMWGYPTDLTTTMDIAKMHGIPVIEDASHCHGSTISDKHVGTIGDVGFFSTQERKLIATGEGGLIVTNNDDIAARVKELRDFGKPIRETPELRDHIGKYGYLFGLNFRLSAMSAALGISQVGKLQSKIVSRTQNAGQIRDGLSSSNWLSEIKYPDKCTPNYYSMVFEIYHPKLDAIDIAKSLYDAGIISDTYRFDIKPLYNLPIFKKYASACPNAEAMLNRIITLPTHEGLDREDIKRIITCLQKFNT